MASSSGDKAFNYDVFLSFSGEDTRNTFTDHLYHRLVESGFCTFRDKEELNTGEELKPEIKKAIKESRALIVVLSKNYPTSRWCLDELLLILEQRRKCNRFVLPVFYGVDATDVRNHRGSFDIIVKPSPKWTDYNVSQWKEALMEIAEVAGVVVSGPETLILKKIVNTLFLKLDHKQVPLPLNLLGMSIHDQEINSWLMKRNLEVEFLAIYGMGGSGKTTLAKHIYNSIQENFEYVSIVEDIGSICKGANGLLKLQQQLLNDILGGKNRKIPCVSRGVGIISKVLETKRSLIILDDIEDRKQLVALLGTGMINALSKIIITTRENPDTWFDLSCWSCQKYEIKLLNDEQSSELLCRHAFGFKFPLAGFEELVLQAVQYCEGNPLALEVLGSSLFKNDLESWVSQLRLLDREIDSRIQPVLVRSYESLPSDTLKGLFLHIACFFIGIDLDYVVKILEPDYSAISGIKTLTKRCLLSVSSNKNIMMHRLVQEMAKSIVRQESIFPAKRSRVWLSSDSYKILIKGMGSETIEGLALDMQMMLEENLPSKSLELKTDALKNMDRLKLLQLNFVELDGSFEDFPDDLRWLCWLGFHLRTIPSNLYMRSLVAIDMSYSKLEVFEPPTAVAIQSLKILNLKDSHDLVEIRNIFIFPNLETLVLWNCYALVNVCKTIGSLKILALLNLIGCKNLFNREQINFISASASTSASASSSSHHYLPSASGDVVTKQHSFSFPSSLHWLSLKDCHIDYFPLNFHYQPALQYLNLANSLFVSWTYHTHLDNLRVLDLSFCSRVKCLTFLPDTLAELYVYGCELLERITFQSSRFTLQEFGYLGCIRLYEVEGFIKLVPIAKLDESELGHMKWLKQYQNYQLCLVGDDELTAGRSWQIQMLNEFGIMSISLPDMKDPNMTPKYISKSSSLSLFVPPCPKNKRLKGINITFKYAISGDDWAWFCKVTTTNGVEMYNPKVFGKPEFGESCIWLSYWPIAMLDAGDKLIVSIVVISGLEVHECGVSFVYSDQDPFENKSNMRLAEILGGDLSRFQLSTGAYYLCRRDFFEPDLVDRLTPNWFRILVDDTVDFAEVRGWRKTGRMKHVNRSYTEVKTIRCIIRGPQLDDIYNIAELSETFIGDKTLVSTSSLLQRETKSGTKSVLTNEKMKKQKQGEGMFKAFGSDEDKESNSPEHWNVFDPVVSGPESWNVFDPVVSGHQEIKAVALPERPGQPECQYYLKTGTCKFGATCKFHHPRGMYGWGSPNVSGLPIRPNEPGCPYYLRTGLCGFGNTCKFNHPLPSNMMVPFSGSLVHPTVQSLTSPGQRSYPGGIRPSFVPNPRWQAPSNYAQGILPHGVDMVPENVFPERPGQPECRFYMKTGDCIFGATCRFHHPKERVFSTPDFVLSPIGLPLRPGEPLCAFYSRYGICKFGASCKFDHPMPVFT